MKHRIIALLILVCILSTLILTVAAEAGVTPRYNNTSGTTTNFTISAAGKATITAGYNAYPSYFRSATITSYIEKRTLGVFWTKVDIGTTNNEWIDTSTEYTDFFGHEFYLDKAGTYRAKVVYEISGTGGSTDVINYEQERTY